MQSSKWTSYQLLLAVLILIVGVGAFLWWAGRDMLQGTCSNCGNDFQIFKSTLNDELQLCPFCSQPFLVEDEFVRDSVKFSNSSTTFGQAFRDFSARSKKGGGILNFIHLHPSERACDAGGPSCDQREQP